MSDGKPDEMSAIEWRAFLEDNLDALLEGMPKRPDGWWRELPECPVRAMFELFPFVRTN